MSGKGARHTIMLAADPRAAARIQSRDGLAGSSDPHDG
jgi:hypothetical protein